MTLEYSTKRSCKYFCLESGFPLSFKKGKKPRCKREPRVFFTYDERRCEYLRSDGGYAKQGEEKGGGGGVIKLAEFLTQAGIKIKRHEKPLLKSAVYLRLEIVDRTIDIGSYIRDL